MFLFGYKFYHNTKMVVPAEADLHSGKAEIDREEEEYLANQAAINHANDSRFKKIYQKAFGVLF